MKLSLVAVAASLAVMLAACSATGDDTTHSPTPPRASESSAASDTQYAAFCELLREGRDADAAIGPYMDEFVARVGAASDSNDPEAIAAANALGVAMADGGARIVTIYDDAAALVDDPVLVHALEVSNRSNSSFTISLGEALAGAVDLNEVDAAFSDFDTEMQAAAADEDGSAILELNLFSLDTCGFALRQQ